MTDTMIPPVADLEAQLSLCGCLVLDLRRAEDVPDVRRSFFGDEHLGLLFEHLVVHSQSYREFDPQLFIAQVKGAGDFERIGEMKRLGEAAEAVAVASHVRYYANLVMRDAQRRELWKVGMAAISAAHDIGEVGDVVAKLDKQLLAIDELGAPLEVQSAADVVPQVIERAIVAKRERRGGLEIGISEFDSRIGGLFPGELVILAARTSCGKSSLAMQVSEYVVQTAGAALFVSLEMSAVELITRTMAGDAAISSVDIRSGSISDAELDRLVEAGEKAKQLPLFVLDPPRCTTAEVRKAAKRIQRTHGLSLLVVDYLTLLAPASTKAQRHEQVGELTRDLKAIARDLSVPVLCLAQLSREAESSKTGKPKLSHLRESGSIEQDADMVLLIHRPELNSPEAADVKNVVELLVAKNRNGPCAEFELFFDAARTRFTPLERRYTEFDSWNGK